MGLGVVSNVVWLRVFGSVSVLVHTVRSVPNICRSSLAMICISGISSDQWYTAMAYTLMCLLCGISSDQSYTAMYLLCRISSDQSYTPMYMLGRISSDQSFTCMCLSYCLALILMLTDRFVLISVDCCDFIKENCIFNFESW